MAAIAMIVVVQILTNPFGGMLSYRIPPAFLSLFLLVALQECFMNWRCFKQAESEFQPDDAKDQIEFIKVSSRMMLAGAVLTFAVIAIFILGGPSRGWYLAAETAIIIVILFASLVLDPGFKSARVLLREHDKYPVHIDAVFMALFLNFFVVALPYFVLFLGLFAWMSSGR